MRPDLLLRDAVVEVAANVGNLRWATCGGRPAASRRSAAQRHPAKRVSRPDFLEERACGRTKRVIAHVRSKSRWAHGEYIVDSQKSACREGSVQGIDHGGREEGVRARRGRERRADQDAAASDWPPEAASSFVAVWHCRLSLRARKADLDFDHLILSMQDKIQL
jgi:hypothetical protein